MKRNFVVFICMLLGLFFASSRVLHATVIHGAVMHGVLLNYMAPVSADPCAGKSVGQSCTGGALYGGQYNGSHYMVTPGGCSDESCTGAGGTDGVTKAWANGSGTSAWGVTTGAASNTDGKGNTAILMNYTDSDAAHWCATMNYGGYTDWFLPAPNEISSVLYANKAALGGFAATDYWSSTEAGIYGAVYVNFTDGSVAGLNKATGFDVRCVRTY